MAILAAALVAGMLFGVGLVVSQMIDPGKVLGFLDIAGKWDPSLAFVMAGALAVAIPGFRLARTSGAPALAERFDTPRRQTIDGNLVAGAAIFGIGWGLAGFCPGPAIAALGLGRWEALLFVLAMLVGAWIFHATRARPSPAPA